MLRRCVEILEWEGAGHTFAIHTEDADAAKRFAAAVPASRVLVNTPAALGGIGATTCLFPALTLGCGAVGGSATSENVGPMHLLNLRYVAHGQRELAEYFEVDSAAVSRMVDSLEKGGFITRRPNEENRRCNSIELTEKGHRADETWRERCREMEELMLDGFSAEERERFAGYLSRAYRNLRGQKEGVL